MNTNEDNRIRLIRDVEANMVPSGDKVTLVAGNLVQITQSLGGNYTIVINGVVIKKNGPQRIVINVFNIQMTKISHNIPDVILLESANASLTLPGESSNGATHHVR